MLYDPFLMFSQWLKAPLAIGGVVPSAAPLSKAMARAVAGVPPGKVVMLGGGTGAIAGALLASGIAPEDLVVVERNRVLHQRLTVRCPGASVVLCDAADTNLLERAIGGATVRAIVSALPLLAMSHSQIDGILRSITRLISEDGTLIQYTYGPSSPIPEDVLRKFGLSGRSIGRIWLNLPPANIWRYRRTSGAAPAFAVASESAASTYRATAME